MPFSFDLGGTCYTPTKLLCIGRNYAKHAQELGNAVPSEPVVFLKPTSALAPTGGSVVLPPQSDDVHYEAELVVVIGREARQVAREEAMHYVAGYAAGLDMTARDVQSAAKAKGLPWSIAKGFDTFAPLGPAVPVGAVDSTDLTVRLQVNGAERQSGRTSDMLFDVPFLVHYLSHVFTLYPGDLIYTGTPEGVAAVQPGDELVVAIDGLPELRVDVRR
jgi:2-keto-4-pentenoate hydratase/2-oxohepta-3-ene-1,7-dioic acid hydratase in catechol pathway